MRKTTEIRKDILAIRDKYMSSLTSYVRDAFGKQYFVSYIGDNTFNISFVYDKWESGNDKTMDLTIQYTDYMYTASKGTKNMWKMSVYAMGMFDISGNSREAAYYSLVGKVMADNGGLETIVRQYQMEAEKLINEYDEAYMAEDKAAREAANAKREAELAAVKETAIKAVTESNGNGYVVLDNNDLNKAWFIYRKKNVAIKNSQVFNNEREAYDYVIANHLKTYKVVEVSKLKIA